MKLGIRGDRTWTSKSEIMTGFQISVFSHDTIHDRRSKNTYMRNTTEALKLFVQLLLAYHIENPPPLVVVAGIPGTSVAQEISASSPKSGPEMKKDQPNTKLNSGKQVAQANQADENDCCRKKQRKHTERSPDGCHVWDTSRILWIQTTVCWIASGIAVVDTVITR